MKKKEFDLKDLLTIEIDQKRVERLKNLTKVI